MSVYRENATTSDFRATTTTARPLSQQVVLNGLNFKNFRSSPPLLEADDDHTMHFDSEITIQFEGELQTLYVGPVVIKDDQLFHENNPDRCVSSPPIQVVLVEKPNNAESTEAVNGSTAAAAATTTTTMPTQATDVADLTVTVADSGIIDPKNGGKEESTAADLITEKTTDPPCCETVSVEKPSDVPHANETVEKQKESAELSAERNSPNPESYENPSPGSDSGIENGPEELPETQPTEITQEQPTTDIICAVNTEEVEAPPKEKTPERQIVTRKHHSNQSSPRSSKKRRFKREASIEIEDQLAEEPLVDESAVTVEEPEEISIAVEEPELSGLIEELSKGAQENCEFIIPDNEPVGDEYEVLHELEVIPSESDPVNYQVIHVNTERFIIQEVAEEGKTVTKGGQIKCAKCTMSFKTEVWYKKHLINYHGVDLSNIAHFLTNIQQNGGGGEPPGEEEQQAILNDLLNNEEHPTTSNDYEDFSPAFDDAGPPESAGTKREAKKKEREQKLAELKSALGEKKKRVELISFDQEEELNVDALKNPFVFEYLTKETKPQPEKLEQLIKEVQQQQSNDKENQRNEQEDEEAEFRFHQDQILTITTNDQTKYGCKLCGAQFTKRFSVPPHIYRVHMRKRDKVCQYCNRGFSQTGDLTRHVRTHTGNKPFKCDFTGCNLAFISSGDLFKHSKRHQAAGVPKPHICDICSIPFERNYDLMRHKIRHRMDEDPNVAGFKCEICQKRFARKDQYRNHTYRHLGYKPFKCDCGKSFADASNFNKHKKTHLGFLQNTGLKCDRCGKEFRNKVAISKHVVACIRRQSLK